MIKLDEKTMDALLDIPGIDYFPSERTIDDDGILSVDIVEDHEAVRQSVRNALTAYLPHIKELKFRVSGPVRPLQK